MDTGEGSAMLCPSCGYDLRGSESERCSECGTAIDRAALAQTMIPWAHRKQVGRRRGLLRTLRLFILDDRGLRLETARPQDARAAVWFTAILAMVPLLIGWGIWTAIIAIEGRETFAVQPANFIGLGATALPGWCLDLAVPWSAGAVLWPVLPMCMVPLAWQLASAPARVRVVEGLSEPRRSNGKALMRYASSPLVLLLPAAVMVGLAALLEDTLPDESIFALLLGGWSLALLGAGGMWLRTGQWAARVLHSSLAGWGAAGEVVVRWAAVTLLWLGLVPWCIGFTWIVIDSFL